VSSKSIAKREGMTDDKSGNVVICMYDFLIVINYTRGCILHRFRGITFDMLYLYIWLPLLRLTPPGGVPLGRSP